VTCTDGQKLPNDLRRLSQSKKFAVFSSIPDDEDEVNTRHEMLSVSRSLILTVWYDFWINPSILKMIGTYPNTYKWSPLNHQNDFYRIKFIDPIRQWLMQIFRGQCVFFGTFKIFNTLYLAIPRDE
jgi:hypothetical protein